MMGVTVTPFQSKCDGRDTICYAWLPLGSLVTLATNKATSSVGVMLCAARYYTYP